jgi:MFS family permease
LVILVALGGLVRGAADNANSTLVPATAALGGIPMERAAGLFSSANNAGLLLGAPLAGVLISLFGPPSVIAGDAVSFAFAAATVAGCLPAATRPDTGERQNYFRSLAEGLRFIRGDRLLLAIATMVAVTNLLDIGLINVELPVWVRTNHGGAGTVGLLLGGFAVGGLTGALTASWLGPRLPRWKAYSFGFLIAGSPPFVVLAVFHTVPPVLVLLFVVGLAGGTLNPMLGAAQYERIPEALRARVLGAVRASAWLGVPLGSLLAGALVQGIGLHATLLATGAVFFLATLCPFVFRAWRQLDRQPADPEGPAGADQSYVDSANASSVAESAAAG